MKYEDIVCEIAEPQDTEKDLKDCMKLTVNTDDSKEVKSRQRSFNCVLCSSV